MPADLPDYDAQDTAEVLDEDNLLPDSDRMKGGDDGLTFDSMPDVFDSTYARGDADVDGDDEALDADEESDELLKTLGDEGDDEDSLDDDDPVDALDADRLPDETLDVDFEDGDIVDGTARLDRDEVELVDVADADSLGGASAISVADLESETLSDEDLMELDYKDPSTGETRGGENDDVERGSAERKGGSQSRADMAAGDLVPASLDRNDPAHPSRQDERLDEGLEETFPASDPVASKHIT